MSDFAQNLLSIYYGFGKQTENEKTLSTHDSINLLNDDTNISLLDDSLEDEEIFTKEESKEDTIEQCEEGFSTLDENSSICDEETFGDEDFLVEYEDVTKKLVTENNSEILDTDICFLEKNFEKLKEENEIENFENKNTYPDHLKEDEKIEESLISCRKFSSMEETNNGNFFNLNGSGISQFPKNIFDQFPNLQMLYLEGNKLNQLPDELFTYLKSLQWLDVRNNQIKFLPLSIKGHLNLETILIQKNQVERLPLELGTLLKLKNLQTANNPLLYPPKEILNLGSNEVLKFLRAEWNKNCPDEAIETKIDILPNPSTILCYQQEKNKKKKRLVKDHQNASKVAEKSLIRKRAWNYKPSNRYNFSLLSAPKNIEELNLCENCASLKLDDHIKNTESCKTMTKKENNVFTKKVKCKNLQGSGILNTIFNQHGPKERSRYVKNHVYNLISHKENSKKLCQLNLLKIDLVSRDYEKGHKSFISNKIEKKEFDIVTKDATVKKLNPLQLNDSNLMLNFLENYLGVNE